MRNSAAIWVLGGAASVVLNLGAAAGLLAAMQPQPVVDQPAAASRLNVTAQEVTRSDARQRSPDSKEAQETTTDATRLNGGAIAHSMASPEATPSKPVQTQVPQPTAVARVPARAPNLTAMQPLVRKTGTTALATQVAATMQPVVSKTHSTHPKPAKLTPGTPVVLAGLPQPPDTPSVVPQAPTINSAPQRAPKVTTGTAMLAFPASGPVDPVSLAAFQSFTQPGAATGAALRDDLQRALSLPCSRMQVTFDPDTTTLRLSGHVPEASQRAPVLAALQAQMGNDITVAGNLLVLPAPQCGALTGIADVGLAQSTDQITNSLIVGADTHARSFRYLAGDPLVMSLTAPDYPAYVYVDYFDADGNVIHLSPNDQTPLQAVTAKSVLNIGATSADAPGLFVTIGPPYGQEIAAAFAASVPLYNGNRPLVEPAAPYLDWLQQRVARARAEHADFKGEWVYFFVTTAPA